MHPACARRFGLPRTKRRPSFSSVHMLGLRPSTRGDLGARLLLADSEDEEARGHEAERVEEDRVRRGEDLHEHAAETRPADLRRRAADLELRVAFDDLVAVDERREVRHVRDVEEDLEDPDEEADDEELPERQGVRDIGDRDVTSSTARPKSPTIRIGLRGRRSTQTPAGSVKRMNGRNSTVVRAATSNALASRTRIATSGKRELADLRAELADRLGRPQLQEVAVAPEPAGRPEATHRRSGRERDRGAEERDREDVQLSVRVRRIPKVVLRDVQADARSGPRPSASGARGRLRVLPSRRCPRRAASSAAWRSIIAEIAPARRSAFAVVALEHEETSDAPVVLLGQGAHLARAYDAHEAGLLENLQVVADRSLRHVERSGELGRARRALARGARRSVPRVKSPSARSCFGSSTTRTSSSS